MTNLTNLKNALTQEYATKLEATINAIRNLELYVIDKYLTKKRWEQLKLGEITRKKAEEIAIKKATKLSQKRLQIELDCISELENTNVVDEFTLVIEWKQNSTWGKCPKAELLTNTKSYLSKTITGCGYDKESTATAEVLKNCNAFMLELYKVKNDNIEIENRELFGYGSGHGLLPYFEAGVGMSCLYNICGKIGYDFKTIASNKNTTTYTITKR